MDVDHQVYGIGVGNFNDTGAVDLKMLSSITTLDDISGNLEGAVLLSREILEYGRTAQSKYMSEAATTVVAQYFVSKLFFARRTRRSNRQERVDVIETVGPYFFDCLSTAVFKFSQLARYTPYTHQNLTTC